MEPEGILQMILGMADLQYWLVHAAMLAGALYLLREGSRAFWRLRIITDTPIARVRSAPQGYVELGGLARPQGVALSAPLTSIPCLWYRFKIEEHRGVGRNKGWRTIESGVSDASFLLADDGGTCLVEPAGAHLRLRRRDLWQGSSRRPGGNQGQGWLESLLAGHGRYRFTEERIEPGEPIFVLGHLETPRRGPEDRERLRLALLRVWKQDPRRMRAFDSDGDGRISPDEWERAREKAERLAARSERELSRAPVLSRIRATADPRHPFVISTFTEQELATRLRWQALGLAAGFVALAGALGLSTIARLATP